MNEIIIIGGGGHAKVLISILRRIGSSRVIGYVDRKEKGRILDVPFLGDDEQLPKIKMEYPSCCAVIGIGQVGLSDKRRHLKVRLDVLDFHLPAIIAPGAVVADSVVIGEGTVVMDGVVLQPGVRIGKGAIINTGAVLDHDCEVGDFVHIAPGVTLSGGVQIGSDSMICTGANVIQYRKIIQGCLVGAGATVVDDCLIPGTYLGTPARMNNESKIFAR